MATYYWIGGNGTWNNTNTTNWSNASGGSSGFGPPLSTDTVIFDSASGTGTCTTAAGSACATATLNSSTLGLTLGANHTMSGTFTLTLGTLSLGSNTLSSSTFSSSNSNTRTIAFGTGNITLTGSNAVIWTTTTSTGLSVTGTPVVNCTYSGATGSRTINTGSGLSEANSISFNVSAGTDTITSGGSGYVFKNLNLTGFSGTFANTAKTIYGSFTASGTATYTAGSNALTFAATSGTQTITTNGATLDFSLTFNGVGGSWQLVDNLTTGSTRTVTLTNGTLDLNSKTLSCGIFSSSNFNVRTITAGASGQINVTGNSATVISMGTPGGLTVTNIPTNFNLTYSGSTGTRTIILGTPKADLTGVFNINVTAGSDVITNTGNGRWYSANFTGFTGTWTIAGSRVTVTKDLTISSGMTISATNVPLEFNGVSETGTITTNGKTIDAPISFIGVGGTWTFADALTQGSTKAFTITEGTVKLKAGVTSTVGVFATSGSNQKYLQSTTAGSQATLSQASGTVNASYLTIKDINATGGATWNAYRNLSNIDAGNNTGWDFLSTPVTTTTLAMRLGFGL